MLITAILLLLTVIAIGITYVAHLQRRMLDAQDALICHFIDLVKVEIDNSVAKTDSNMHELISSRK